MLLFIIVLVITVVATIIAIATADSLDILAIVSVIISILAWVAVGIMVLLAACCNVGAEGTAMKYQQRYDALVYQLENELYDNDNDIGKKELYNEIRSWNENISYGKAMQHNSWIGMFYPDIYDRFELIELK